METPKLIYFFDTLCGWCYGFSPVVMRLREEYAGKMNFEIVSGGLAIGDRVAPIGEKFSYIKNALKTVEEYAGVEFGEGFKEMAEEGSYIYDSLPPATALCLVKKYMPEAAFPFAHRMHDIFFREGRSLNDYNTYYDLAVEYGLDELEFVREMKEPSTETLAREDFKRAYNFGISGFPAAVIYINEQYFLVNRGYQPYDQVKEVVEKVMKSARQESA